MLVTPGSERVIVYVMPTESSVIYKILNAVTLATFSCLYCRRLVMFG